MKAPSFVALLPLLIATAARAIPFASPSFEVLGLEAEKDPAHFASAAQAKAQASEGYDGEGVKGVHIQSLKPVGYATEGGKTDPIAEDVAVTEPVQPKSGQDTYHFEGRQPVKGINIYTPVKDTTGNEGTGKPEKPADPFKKYMYIAAGVAVAATVGGIFFAPLLFLGGFAAGVAAVLWFLGRKTAGK